MARIATKKILNELSKLQEYDYPTEQSSVFILPDGKMVGSNKIFNHGKMLEQIIGEDLDVKKFFRYLVATRVVRLVVDDSILYININTHLTNKQKNILKKLRKHSKYDDFAVDMYGYHLHTYATTGPNEDYIYSLLDLKKP